MAANAGTSTWVSGGWVFVGWSDAGWVSGGWVGAGWCSETEAIVKVKGQSGTFKIEDKDFKNMVVEASEVVVALESRDSESDDGVWKSKSLAEGAEVEAMPVEVIVIVGITESDAKEVVK